MVDRRCWMVVVATIVALATAAPAYGADRGADPLRSLGATSPMCQAHDVGATAAANCTGSGSIAHRYPIGSYGLDVQIGFSLTHVDRTFLGALQSIAALVWMALIYVVEGVLLLVEWAFSLDLLGRAMSSVARTLLVLHEQVLGEPWFLAALSVTALWGIWRGLVQRQTTQTLAGLASTVGLMLCGLVVLSDPVGTVGHASKLANDASVGVLAAATTGRVEHPDTALADAMGRVFDATVRDPWCALEFGSVEWCRAPARGSRTVTNGDLWLAYPAGSGERKSLYSLVKGKNPDDGGGLLDLASKPVLGLLGADQEKPAPLPDGVKARVAEAPERIALQEAGGTFARCALLVLVAAGTTGAVALLGFVGIRLLLAAILALLLLLFTPAVLLAPAFGEGGRATFIAWVKRLGGALLAKLLYALFLAIVLAAAGALARVDIGWFATWLLQIAFWWGVLLKRHELLGLVPAAQPLLAGGGSGVLARGYYAMQIGRGAARSTARARTTATRAMHAVGERRADRAAAKQTAVAELAGEHLDLHARDVLGQQQGRAIAMAAERPQLERELRAIDRRLAGYDESRVTARAHGISRPVPTEEQAAMLERRRELQARLASPEQRRASQMAAHAHRNAALSGDPIGDRDLRAYRTTRRRELDMELPIDDERHLRAAGIDPDAYRAAPPAEQSRLRANVREHVSKERALLDAAEGEPWRAVVAAHAAAHLERAEIRRRAAEEHARRRQERRERRARGSVPKR